MKYYIYQYFNSNVPEVFKKVLAKRLQNVNGKSEVQYLMLTYDYDCMWRNRTSLARYKRLIDDFEQGSGRTPSLRRSRRVKDLDLEAGQSQVYYD